MAIDDELEQIDELTKDIRDLVIDIHGDRGRRALDAVEENRVKKYNDFTVIVGMNEEYIVENDACTCRDYRYNLDEGELCWHLIAANIADKLNLMDSHDMWYSEVHDFL